MPIPAAQYVSQLQLLRGDLEIVMAAIPSGPTFDAAKVHAEAMAPLIAGQIAVLQNAGDSSIGLNPANPVALREAVDHFIALLPDANSQKKFAEYSAMLDSLINRH